MYGNIKTHKTDNPAKVITSGWNTAAVHLSIFVEKVLFEIANELSPRKKRHKSHIKDHLNNSNLYIESDLVSFDNKIGINSVIKFLDERACKDPPTQCVNEVLELFLNCNISVFNNTSYIQIDDTAQVPHMLHS